MSIVTNSHSTCTRIRATHSITWRALCTVALLIILAAHIDFAAMRTMFMSLQWSYVVLATALIMLDRLVVTLRWWILLAARDVDVSFWRLLLLHLAAGFYGSFLPTSFSTDVLRIVMLIRHTGRSTDCVAASIFDRLLMLTWTFLFAFVAIGLYSALLPVAGLTTLLVLIVTGIALLIALSSIPSLRQSVMWVMRRSMSTRIFGSVRRFALAMRFYSASFGAIALSSLLTVGALFLRVLIVLILGLAVGVSIGYLQYLMIMPAAWLATILPISIGGLGLQEGAYAAALALIGVSATVAVLISLLDQVLVRLVSLCGAFLWLARPRTGSDEHTSRVQSSSTLEMRATS